MGLYQNLNYVWSTNKGYNESQTILDKNLQIIAPDQFLGRK